MLHSARCKVCKGSIWAHVDDDGVLEFVRVLPDTEKVCTEVMPLPPEARRATFKVVDADFKL